MRQTRKIIPDTNAYAKAVNAAREALKEVSRDTVVREGGIPRTNGGATTEAASPRRPQMNGSIDKAADDLIHDRREAFAERPEGIALEAIVQSKLRPSLYIRQDQILDQLGGMSPFVKKVLSNVDLTHEDKDVLDANRALLQKVALSAGRLDLRNGFMNYAGSAWLVEGDIVVTNRHVAELFAQRRFMEPWRFAPGRFDADIEVEINTLAQLETPGRRATSVVEILWIAEPHEPDMALLRVNAGGATPIEFSATVPPVGAPIAVIGYPAEDPRDNAPSLIGKFFGEVFDVKRFAPGRILDKGNPTEALTYDASTLGGNSGSAVIDLATGKAVGLHFQGETGITNTAVPAAVVQAALRRLKTVVAMPAAPAAAPVATEASRAANFADRGGYDPEFLGKAVPWPDPGHWTDDLAPLLADPAQNELKYTHFSVKQCKSRRLPLVTAVNIDGNKLRKLPREGRWRLDGRIAEEHQVGNALYVSNPLDRGHMVRRLDPCWSERADDDATILAAQDDTFHYTNSAPQHEDLNQRDWVGLEDYVLDAAGDFGLKVTVFTGPVLRDDDRPLTGQSGDAGVALPREFWKVAVMVHGDTGRLVATGYVLSHGEMIASLTEAAFVFGAYETYQVPLALIEREARISFGDLRRHDPLDVANPSEAAFGHQVFRVRGPESLKLGVAK